MKLIVDFDYDFSSITPKIVLICYLSSIGRRATVMECEHGPRKRHNALKRLVQLHGDSDVAKKIPNMTCPARLFVKKVRKFPQCSVPLDADPKLLRQLQEQSLKHVRDTGLWAGEIRFVLHFVY